VKKQKRLATDTPDIWRSPPALDREQGAQPLSHGTTEP
jgi:hypothetical protein